MRTCRANRQPLHYATYTERTEVEDEYGNLNWNVDYTDPIAAEWNISTVDSDAEVELFGINAFEVIRIVPDALPDGFDEAAIIWHGVEPTEPHNYAIAGIRKTLNTVTIYARKVNVSYAVPEDDTEPEEPEGED
jgi:hypothetical protein